MGISALDSAITGLRVAQQQLDVIANNVSNVTTPGYSRKILPQQNMIIDGKGAGVASNAITRSVDLNLARDFWTQVSSVNFYSVQSKYLTKIQEFHGSPELEISISAEVAELRDKFAALSDSPEDTFLQRSVVQQATVVAGKMNDFSRLITQMRNDAGTEISSSVSEINRLLDSVANLNQEIKTAKAQNRTTAALEDSRDQAISELSQHIELTSFMRGDGVLVVQTTSGKQLADEKAEKLYFTQRPVAATSGYDSTQQVNSLYLGDPNRGSGYFNLTAEDLGGKIGALLDVRDNVLPRQQAMLDELAHKMAMRFEAQGLRLFSDASGTIPADTAPNPATNPPTPVPYVGFSGVIQVNRAIINDNSLLVKGTRPLDVPVQAGSNEVIRRIVDYTFGDTYLQQAAGTTDLRASAVPTSLQAYLGLYSSNQVTGTKNVANYTDLNALLEAGRSVLAPGTNDEFTITFEESRTGLGPTTITVSLADAQANHTIGSPGINDALDQLIAEVNAQITAASVPAGLAATATRGAYGQLTINSRGDITIDASVGNGMSDAGLAYLGLTSGTSKTTDPWFDVQVGNDPAVRITIAPGETEVDLVNKMDKLNAGDVGVAGLGVRIDPATGRLTLRPGDDVTNPNFGGALRLTGGTITANGTGTITGGMASGMPILEVLFGNASPIQDVSYASLTSTGGQISFRTNELGPRANLNVGSISSSNLIDFSQKLVNRQAEESNVVTAKIKDEKSFHDLLQSRLLNESSVNIDEELSNLIVVQTAYTAAARVINAIDEQFQELLNAMR